VHIYRNANLNSIFSPKRIRGFAADVFGYLSFIGNVAQEPNRISVPDRSSCIGRLRCVGAVVIVAAGFGTYGTFAPAARAASPGVTDSPAAAATYPAGDAGTAAPAVPSVATAAESAAAEAASAAAGADPAQYHQPQTPQYHATTAVSVAPGANGANIRAVAASLTADAAPVAQRVRAHTPVAEAAPARATMRKLTGAARAIAVGHATTDTVSVAVATRRVPASIHVLTKVIAVQQSSDISVSRNPHRVVSASLNRSGTAHSAAVENQRIGRQIRLRIHGDRRARRSRSASRSPVDRLRLASAVPRPDRAVAAAAIPALPDRPLKNTRAMLQLGMLFGLAYVGFLAVWFWSTRFRRRIRRPLRL
jgi:hypothetical protein